MKIILGSKSPRRKIILSGITDKFEVMHPDADESVKTGESPVNYSERISEDKGRSIFRNISKNENAFIISCDTIVCLDGEIFGKPESYDEAFSFLKKLSGKTHSVISSICLIKTNGSAIEKILSGTETTLVSFLHLSDEDIENYLSKTEYMDKAGAYAAQENGDLIIGKIDGSLTNVIGFPLRLFFRMLIEFENYTDVFH